MTFDTAVVSDGWAIVSEGWAQRATGRHEGKTGGRRQSAGGMMWRGRRRVRDIKGAAKS